MGKQNSYSNDDLGWGAEITVELLCVHVEVLGISYRQTYTRTIINWIADIIKLLKCVLKFSKFTRGSHSSASSGTYTCVKGRDTSVHTLNTSSHVHTCTTHTDHSYSGLHNSCPAQY